MTDPDFEDAEWRDEMSQRAWAYQLEGRQAFCLRCRTETHDDGWCPRCDLESEQKEQRRLRKEARKSGHHKSWIRYHWGQQ